MMLSPLPITAETADALLERGDVADAAAIYKQVYAQEPYHPYAFGCLCATRSELTGDATWWQKLLRFSVGRDHPRIDAMLQRSFPFFGLGLEYPHESIIDLCVKMVGSLPELAASGNMKPGHSFLSVSSAIESPSASLAVFEELAAHGRSILIKVKEVQRPDPRLPRVPVDFQVWRYIGTDTYATPNVEKPSIEIADAVAAIAARSRYAADAWSYWAKEAAQTLGVTAVQGLLGTMVHPPQKPEHRQDLRWWQWLYRVQIAAALILSHIDTGWQNSERRRALLSLANGPMDWTVNAAVIALVLLARNEPEARPDVDRLLSDLWAYVDSAHDTPYVAPLLWATSVHLNLSPEKRAELFAMASTPKTDPLSSA